MSSTTALKRTPAAAVKSAPGPANASASSRATRQRRRKRNAAASRMAPTRIGPPGAARDGVSGGGKPSPDPPSGLTPCLGVTDVGIVALASA